MADYGNRGKTLTRGFKKQDRKYLTKKRVHLNAEGVLIDDVYYGKLNSTMAMTEVTYRRGQFFLPVTSKNLRSSSSFILNNDNLYGNIYLHLEYVLSENAEAKVELALVEGWGYKIIRRITVVYGSSNSTQLEYDGDTLYQILMGETSTAERRVAYFKNGGNLTPQNPLGNGEITATADVLIPLAFSSFAGAICKKPFDASMLASPITVKIEFGSKYDMLIGLSDDIAAAPSSFAVADVYCTTGKFYNRRASLAADMMLNPSAIYSYPYIHKESFSSAVFNSDSNTNTVVQLRSLLDGDLPNLSFGVILISNRVQSGLSRNEYYNYENISNVRLNRSGSTRYFSPAFLYRTYNLESLIGGSHRVAQSYSSGALFTQTSVAQFFQEVTVRDSYMVRIDFGRKNSIAYRNHFENVERYSNQNLQLSFNVAVAAPANHQLFGTYYYNSLLAIKNKATYILIS